MTQPIRFAFKLNIHGLHVGTPANRLIELGVAADRLGYDGVYVIDHMLLPGNRINGYTDADPARPYFLDAWTTLAAIAARTERIKLGTQVTPLGLRHPAFVAKMATSIDQISGGRLLLQVGAGHQEVDFASFGLPFPGFKERMGQLSEGIKVIRMLWSEDGPVSFDGKHWQVQKVDFWPKPVQARPPIWLGGASKAVRRVLARQGDGWTPAAPQQMGLTPEFYKESWQEVVAWAREAGRDPAQLTPAALFYTSVAPTREQALAKASILQRRKDWADLPLQRLQDLGIIVAGTPADCIKQLERYVDAGVRYFTLSFFPLSDLDVIEAGMKLYAEQILPHFA